MVLLVIVLYGTFFFSVNRSVMKNKNIQNNYIKRKYERLGVLYYI